LIPGGGGPQPRSQMPQGLAIHHRDPGLADLALSQAQRPGSLINVGRAQDQGLAHAHPRPPGHRDESAEGARDA
jgi:hypothetical protein